MRKIGILDEKRWCHYRHWLMAMLTHLWRRMGEDRLTVSAGHMAYVTLLSLVPLVTVVLSAFSSFPGFSEVGETLQQFVINNFVPAAGEVVARYLNEFVANAGKMTAVGVSFLFVVAIMLISAIDKSLNHTFKIQTKRPTMIAFSIYWMVLTLGPILIGTSIALSSYLTSLSLLQSGIANDLFTTLLRVLPFILTTLTFMGLYTLVPNTRVRLRHAFAGAAVASILFELSKKVFALYVTHFPSYQLIYGALAVIPILFVWVYFSWCIVLFGAQVTATLRESERWWPRAEGDASHFGSSALDASSPPLTIEKEETHDRPHSTRE
ncbi:MULTISPECIES: virulence factor BrkB family protein [unclassified Salinivibrio]|uniref:virulence factor BrkB family protein n=1 Tax=unclassified Salinivibrio TaxID=2636825 RepID=UPI000986F354|nr:MULTISPECIES: virulence factor BrkB family protein [unclassified Salinivibrio]MPS33261.1 virulence factor BrkB family protein [Salinivibrio sp. VYel7]MPX91765.1 virulence factor BrkB family protein [Salinivibrio sp. VYel1]MPX94646.1 virulence factor BrkB family protein [Salinivibrio sp. VYel9]MPX97742.1 virulence factor BrkB family protein [Salinivibrio sp. VYel6]MPY00958.1 virulence factor BrkB family protein [Salinivibrio sp. VYel4]